jgi:alkanesulfonate monooxygenase SsuD/methylene tetrahydromethanopterin reductase-like flavin-dependent oxidoreductase (luciferase family)
VVKVGVILPVGGSGERSWPRVLELAQRAEAAGLDAVWLPDHFFYRDPQGVIHGVHDAWTLLSAVAAVTERVELGPLVLCSSFHSPGVVANAAVTLDDVSRGRLVLGLGAGWHDPEYEAFGFPTDHRVGRFAEALEIVARLVRGEHVTFEGEYHRVIDAALAPPPARPIPILVASFKTRMLRLTARWADAWNTAWYTAPNERLVEAVRALEAALAAEGRDPAAVERTVGVEVGADGIDDFAGALEGYAALGFAQAIVRMEDPTPDRFENLGGAVRAVRG